MDMSLKCNLIATANPFRQIMFELAVQSYAGAEEQVELGSK